MKEIKEQKNSAHQEVRLLATLAEEEGLVQVGVEPLAIIVCIICMYTYIYTYVCIYIYI